MKKNFYKFALTIISLFLVSSIYAQEVLYVGNYEREDSLLVDTLTAYGYNVTVIAPATFKASPYDTPEAYDDYDVLFLSEGMSSSDANNYAVAEYPIPCVTTEGYSVRNGKWNWQEESVDNETWLQIGSDVIDEGVETLVITDNTHCITAIFEEDDEVLWTVIEDIAAVASEMGVTGFNLDIDDAIALATFNNDLYEDLPSIWAIPEGSEITAGDADGTTINSNVVMMGLIAKGMQTPTQGYFDLMLRSFAWVLGECTVPEEPQSANTIVAQDLNVTVSPNPAFNNVDFSVLLLNAENIAVNIYDITGQNVMTVNTQGTSGINNINLDLSKLTSSQYLYKVVTNSQVYTGKIIKK